MTYGIILIGLFIIGGLWLAGSLFSHRRILTWITSGLTLAWGMFMGASLMARSMGVSGNGKSIIFYVVVSVVLGIGLYLRKKFVLPYSQGRGSGMRDGVILLVLLPALLSTWIIVSSNGQQADGTWVFHGFYNGDTTTFVSLVQKSFFTPFLLDQNPFAANGDLEYPTLLHGAIADFFSFVGVTTEWVHFLPIMTLLGTLVTVPLFFLLFDLLMPEPNKGTWFGIRRHALVYLIEAIIVLYVLAYAWDTYVYPQSHFFLTAPFILFIALLVMMGRSKQIAFWIYTGLATALGIALFMANAVTGAISIALLALFSLFMAASRKLEPTTRGWYLVATVLFLGVFFVFSSGDAQFGLPHFSYGAAGDMVRFAPVIVLLLAALALGASESFISVATVALMGLAFVTFFFSNRAIIIDNASRFAYHALLVGFPLLLPLVIRIGFWVRRELFMTTRDGLMRFVPWVGTGLALLLLALPPLASVASTFDHLLRNDERVISNAWREAVWWIGDDTTPESIILASPHAPWAVPFFTGRSLVRAGSVEAGAYWLSVNDDLVRQLDNAFAGDKDSQQSVVQYGNYLVLTDAERVKWEPVPYEKVFDVKQIVIYRLSQQ